MLQMMLSVELTVHHYPEVFALEGGGDLMTGYS
jgi:hypothetical protein